MPKPANTKKLNINLEVILLILIGLFMIPTMEQLMNLTEILIANIGISLKVSMYLYLLFEVLMLGTVIFCGILIIKNGVNFSLSVNLIARIAFSMVIIYLANLAANYFYYFPSKIFQSNLNELVQSDLTRIELLSSVSKFVDLLTDFCLFSLLVIIILKIRKTSDHESPDECKNLVS